MTNMRRSLEGVFGQARVPKSPAAAYAHAIAMIQTEIVKQQAEVKSGPCRDILDAAHDYCRKAEQLRNSDPEWSYLYFTQAVGNLREGATCKYMTVTRTFPAIWMRQFRPQR